MSFDCDGKEELIEPVTIVSGLPRSGTSMMMRMLEAAGVPILTDGARLADTDNPNGYYELEGVKGLIKGDSGWLSEAGGRAVKVVSPLLPYLPDDRPYKIIVMRRDIDEVLASQRRMLVHRGEPVRGMDDEVLARQYEENLALVERWASSSPGVEAVFLDYNSLLDGEPSQLEALRDLLGNGLDTEAMARIVDPALYRQRRQ